LFFKLLFSSNVFLFSGVFYIYFVFTSVVSDIQELRQDLIHLNIFVCPNFDRVH